MVAYYKGTLGILCDLCVRVSICKFTLVTKYDFFSIAVQQRGSAIVTLQVKFYVCTVTENTHIQTHQCHQCSLECYHSGQRKEYTDDCCKETLNRTL